MKNLRSTKGITLVALIITIIVLLILAIVSIRLIINGGIISRAQNAVNDYTPAEEKEQIKLGYYNYQMGMFDGGENTFTVEGAQVTPNGNNGWTIMFSNGNTYTLSSDGKTISGPTINSETTNSEIAITSTTISKNSTTIELGNTDTLTLTVNPNNATEIPAWTCSDPTVASISASSDGKTLTVNGLKEGTATISATNSTNSCLVQVVYSELICCFDGGSPVLMADGTTKNIEKVKVGDMVMSYNEDTGKFMSQRVKNTIITHNSDDLVYVNLSNGERIGMRAYHPLLTTEGYKSLRPNLAQTTMEVGREVELLEVGDTLVGYGENVKIVSIEQRPEIENYNTYNLSIQGYSNYIVNGIVVHNAGCTQNPKPVGPKE